MHSNAQFRVLLNSQQLTGDLNSNNRNMHLWCVFLQFMYYFIRSIIRICWACCCASQNMCYKELSGSSSYQCRFGSWNNVLLNTFFQFINITTVSTLSKFFMCKIRFFFEIWFSSYNFLLYHIISFRQTQIDQFQDKVTTKRKVKRETISKCVTSLTSIQ